MTIDKRLVSVIVPVHCSASTLPELYNRIAIIFIEQNQRFEIIFVEDCSNDDSWSVIQNLARQDNRVKGLKFSRNYGQHNALLCGIRAATGEIIITIDDDLQHPPEVLPLLLDKLAEGYDLVYGPPLEEKHSFSRNLASKITKIALQNSMGADNARCVSALRVFRTVLRDGFADYRSPNLSIDVLLTWSTSRFAAVPVRHEPRKQGQSGYSFTKLIKHALNMLTGYSTRPLHLASLLGIISALFGLVVLIVTLVRWLIYGSQVPGFAFLVSLIVIFSGTQLIALGIIGEYIARMHFRTMDKPTYLVSETTLIPAKPLKKTKANGNGGKKSL